MSRSEINYQALTADLNDLGGGFSVDDRFRIGGSELLHLGGNVHRAELGTAHGTEMRVFETLFGQSFIVHGFGHFRIERQSELFLPVEREPRAGKRVVAV